MYNMQSNHPINFPHRLTHSRRILGAAPSFFRAFGRFLDGGLIGEFAIMLEL